MRKELLVFGRPYFDEAMERELLDCLHSGWWGEGPRTEKVEELIRQATGAKHAIFLSSGSAALHLAFLASGVDEGDRVIVPAMTYAASAHAVALVGAVPVFADVDPETGNIDTYGIEALIDAGTVAIVPVHFAGRPCDMGRIMSIASRHGLLVIEDAAHAYGASLHGQHMGTFGHAGIFSFNHAKNVAAGESGALITNDGELAERVKRLAHSGESSTSWERFKGSLGYEIVDIGYNYRSTDLSAALLIPQLERFREHQEARKNLWRLYDASLAGSRFLRPPATSNDALHSMYLYQIRMPVGMQRDVVRKSLRDKNIGSGVHYHPLHLQPYYRKWLGYKPGSRPGAESFGQQALSLPLSATLSGGDVKDACDALLEP